MVRKTYRRYTRSEWSAWRENLHTDGSNGYSKQHRHQWCDDMQDATEAIQSVAERPGTQCPYTGLRVLMPDVHAKVNKLVRIPGVNAKERSKARGQMRARLRKAGFLENEVRFVSNIDPPPKICNRMGVKWGQQPADCECRQWAVWVKKYNGVSPKCTMYTGDIVDCRGRKGTVKKGPKVCYWSPGNKKQPQWWYNGAVNACYKVRFPSGHSKVVVAVN